MPKENQPATIVAPKRDASLPREFGGYRLLSQLADGMALVYLAEQSNPRRRVVVKIPRGGLLLTEESRRRFLREVELAANADHAGIVPVLDAGEIDHTPYYTMPFIEGLPIDQHLQSKGSKLGEKLVVFGQLCDVVGALHEKGLIHRDLKPANVLVDTHGSIRLLDFGLAKVSREASELSLSPTVMGTLDYMAPEQAGAAKEVGPQADVYAIGIMLFKAVTGKSPYPISKDLPTQLRIIAETPPEAPSKFNRKLPAPLVQLILRCLDKSPAKRPADANELGQALAAIAGTPSRKPRGHFPFILGATLLALGIAGYAVYINSQGAGSSPNAESATATPTSSPNQQFVPLEAHTYTAKELAALATSNFKPQTSNFTAIPTNYWPLYNQVKKELQNNFDRRRQSAVILALPATAHPTQATLTQGTEQIHKYLQPGSASVIYLQGGEAARLSYNGQSTKLAPQTGQIRFLQM